MDVPLNAQEAEYVAEQVRSGRAASEGEVLREALQLLMERDTVAHEKSDAYREHARRSIEAGYQDCLAGGTVDGEEFIEQLRHELEARRTNGS